MRVNYRAFAFWKRYAHPVQLDEEGWWNAMWVLWLRGYGWGGVSALATKLSESSEGNVIWKMVICENNELSWDSWEWKCLLRRVAGWMKWNECRGWATGRKKVLEGRMYGCCNRNVWKFIRVICALNSLPKISRLSQGNYLVHYWGSGVKWRWQDGGARFFCLVCWWSEPSIMLLWLSEKHIVYAF